MKFITKYSKYILLFVCMFILLETVEAKDMLLEGEINNSFIELNVLDAENNTVGFKNNIDQKYVICNGAEIPYGIPVIVSRVVNLLKVGIPVVLIVLGMIDFLKAVISNDEKNMKASTSTFIRRCLAAVIVLFVFTIVQFAFSLVDEGSFSCVNCIINEECGPINTYENYDKENSTEMNNDNNQDAQIFDFNKLEGKAYDSAIYTYENYDDGTYICKDNVVSYIGNYHSSYEQCSWAITMGDAFTNCQLTTKPYYETKNKKVSSCSKLCKQYPNDIKCIN